MTSLGWLALAAALLVAGAPAAAPGRLANLRTGRRVAADAPAQGRAGGGRAVEGRPTGGRAVTGRGGVAASLRPGSRRWRRPLGAGVTVVAAAAGLAAGPPVALAAAGSAATAWRLALDALDRRAGDRSRVELLAAVRVLVAELEAGSRPGAALSAAAQVTPIHAAVLTRAAAAADAGDDSAAVLREAAATAGLGVAWALGQQTGAALAGVLQRVAADLAAVEEQRLAVGVALSGPRASAVVLALLPAVGIAMGTTMDARPVQFLLGSPDGRLVCCAGVLLDVAGVLWVRRIVSSAARAR